SCSLSPLSDLSSGSANFLATASPCIYCGLSSHCPMVVTRPSPTGIFQRASITN
uniref:Uncharacterized protein n=1 Tax=Mesocestoides corti TaxID=53468 RepID=A0A5K3FY11_MESCO